jgi:hypothetical protein
MNQVGSGHFYQLLGTIYQWLRDPIPLLDNNLALGKEPRELRGSALAGGTAQTFLAPLLALPGRVICYL